MLMFANVDLCVVENMIAKLLLSVEQQLDNSILLFYGQTRQSKQCGFSIYTFDNFKSKSMVSLVRAEKMVLSGLVFARKIARMILIQNI